MEGGSDPVGACVVSTALVVVSGLGGLLGGAVVPSTGGVVMWVVTPVVVAVSDVDEGLVMDPVWGSVLLPGETLGGGELEVGVEGGGPAVVMEGGAVVAEPVCVTTVCVLSVDGVTPVIGVWLLPVVGGTPVKCVTGVVGVTPSVTSVTG